MRCGKHALRTILQQACLDVDATCPSDPAGDAGPPLSVEFVDEDGDICAYVETPSRKIELWLNGIREAVVSWVEYDERNGTLRDEGMSTTVPLHDRARVADALRRLGVRTRTHIIGLEAKPEQPSPAEAAEKPAAEAEKPRESGEGPSKKRYQASVVNQSESAAAVSLSPVLHRATMRRVCV